MAIVKDKEQSAPPQTEPQQPAQASSTAPADMATVQEEEEQAPPQTETAAQASSSAATATAPVDMSVVEEKKLLARRETELAARTPASQPLVDSSVLDEKQRLARRQTELAAQAGSSATTPTQTPTPTPTAASLRKRAEAQPPRQLNTGPEPRGSTEAYIIPDLDTVSEAPPAYGEHHDRVQFSQPGIDADAGVTENGRVNININTKNSRRLADLLAPTLHQASVEAQPSLPPAYIPASLGGQPGQTPPPRLNVVIQIVGSRGDVQPFVALGKVLKETYGHRVRIATHGTFQNFVEENGLEFFSIGGDPAELMAFMVKNPGLMPGIDALKSGEISRRRRGIQQMLLGCWRSCIEAGNGLGPPPRYHAKNEVLDPSAGMPGDTNSEPFVADAIIANPPSFAHIHVAEKLGIPLHMMFTMPWSPTKAFPHPLANIQSSNADDVMTNYLTYTLVEMMTWQGLGDVINRFRESALDLSPLALIWAPGLLTRLKISYTYCWSPALIPKPNDWSSNIDISGFFFLNLASAYTPDPELAAFLEAGPPPVYIGFGSIVVDDPNAMTRTIFEAINLTGVRALVSKGWGGLGADDVGIPEGVFMLGNVPHDWLFERVSAVVHHGGAGTTAAGIKAGKPTLVVPFFGDQPFWGAMIARAKAGPSPIPYKDLTAENLAEAIKFCIRPDTLEQAKVLGQRISEEKGTDVGGQSFHSHLNMESLRCSIAPSRAAVWRVRRTKVRLSALAATVLVDQGALEYADLKLYRSTEYNTEDQPPDPISACAFSLLSSATSIGMTVADMPREIFKTKQRMRESEEELTHPLKAASKANGSNLSQITSSAPSTTDLQGVSRQSTERDPAARSQLSLVEGSEALSSPSVIELPGTLPRQATEPASGTASPGALARHATDPAPGVLGSTPISRNVTNDSQTSLGDGSAITQTESASESIIESAVGSPTPEKTDRARTSTMQTTKSRRRDPSPAGISLEAAINTGRGVGRIVTTGVKSPMNFCLGCAKGFRNIPRLYNDDTVRPIEKVTDLTSGIRVAGKEFGYGLYDGVSGLITQPLRGAEKDMSKADGVEGVLRGAGGLVKGFGKGIGGLIAKPAAGFWGIPAYLMQGVNAQVNKMFTKSLQNYIIMSRITQGKNDYETSTSEERDDMFQRWNSIKFDLRSFYSMKKRDVPLNDNDSVYTFDSNVKSGRPGWLQSQRSSFDGRRRLSAQRSAWKRGFVDTAIPTSQGSISSTSLPPTTATSGQGSFSSRPSTAEDAEFERAIMAAVQETSQGNEQEDAMVEAAIRESVRAVRQRGSLPEPIAELPEKDPSLFEDNEYEINDEEYQALIEKAINQSLIGETGDGFMDIDANEIMRNAQIASLESYAEIDTDEDEENLRRALEESRKPGLPPRRDTAEDGEIDDEEELARAIAASEEEAKRQQSERTEEEIVMEYILKQSMAEEEFKKQYGKGKGRAVADADEDEDDEDLRKALEESLRVSGQGETRPGLDGPSGSGSG